MFNQLGMGEVLLILAAVLLIFGPKKLPELGKSIGQTIREFKKSTRSLSDDAAPETAQGK